jgi:hypothetical protein
MHLHMAKTKNTPNFAGFKDLISNDTTPAAPIQKVVKVEQSANDGHTRLSMWLRDDLMYKLKEQALKENTSIKEIVHRVLEQYYSA